jgi:hypothetical protein
MIGHREFLIVSAIILLVLVVGVVLLARALRSQLARRTPPAPARVERSGRDWAVTPLPTGLARTLTQRGLVNAQQLASMSPAEREFFVATVAARVGEGAKPRLIGVKGADERLAATGTGPVADAGGRAPVGRDPVTVTDPVPSAPLVSGVIHCPVCRTPLGQRSDALLMSRCPGCARRVAARVDGDRLIVTVDYRTKD